MSFGSEIEAAVEGLYRIFARYQLQSPVKGCSCCVQKSDELALESAPLEELPPEALSKYAFKALTTWGDKEDFKHFLPRIFELMLAQDGLGSDEEIVLGKLAAAEWNSWEEEEQRAVRKYFRAEWRLLLATPRNSIEPDSWLCGIARAGDDLAVYLQDWINARSSNAYEHLVEFVEKHAPTYIKKHSLSNAYWQDSPNGVKQVCTWACSGDTRGQLEEIYWADETADYAASLARAIERLEWVFRAPN